jgi:hypothetical protein
LTIFQKNSPLIPSYYDIPRAYFYEFALDKCMRMKYNTSNCVILHTIIEKTSFDQTLYDRSEG